MLQSALRKTQTHGFPLHVWQHSLQLGGIDLVCDIRCAGPDQQRGESLGNAVEGKRDRISARDRIDPQHLVASVSPGNVVVVRILFEAVESQELELASVLESEDVDRDTAIVELGRLTALTSVSGLELARRGNGIGESKKLDPSLSDPIWK